MDKGLILVIIGGLLSCTIYGVIIGAPLTLIGAYFLYKSLKEKDSTPEEIEQRKQELENLDEKLAQKEAEKEEEINKKLSDKQEELDNIQQKLDDMEVERIAEVDEKLKTKKEELENLDAKYEKLTAEKEKELETKLHDANYDLVHTRQKYEEIKKDLVRAEDDLEMQEYGLYEPRYNFIHAVDYKERLDAVRKQQKQMIKDKTAAIGHTDWTMKGSEAKGRAFVNANIKQILRSFNNETTVLISKVKHSNIDNIENRINKTFTSLNNLYKREDVEITKGYLNLKLDELHLAYEY